MARASAPRLRDSLAIAWRTLRSMRTALILLLLLALAAVAGSLVPQIGTADARIAETFREHPARAEWFLRLGLFDVYGSWWFTLIYTLLLVSLAACLFPRTRALVRNALARPSLVRELDGFRHYAETAVADEPPEALVRARRLLRRRRFRVRGPENGGAMLAAEKGLLREVGSLAFHWSFFLLLIGTIYGKGTGFTGTAVIPEGETWAEVHAGYDGEIREGRFFREDHSGLVVSVREFEVSYLEDGTPREFVTRADLFAPGGEPLGPVDIRVNHPGSVLGVKLYQAGYGWAPVIRVTADAGTVADGPVVFVRAPETAELDPRVALFRGVLRLPSLRPQMAVEFTLFPPGTLGPDPALHYTPYVGELPETAEPSLARLDTSGMEPLDGAVVALGGSVRIAEGVVLAFPELREYTVLQVSRDRGLGLVLGAGILILLGLLPALYDSRRRLWVRAERSETGTVLKVGGFALQRREQFEDEFARLVRDLGRTPARSAKSGGTGT